MKPSATAVKGTKWPLINSLLSQGAIMTQLDIRNEGCVIPEATDDKQTSEENRDFYCAAYLMF